MPPYYPSRYEEPTHAEQAEALMAEIEQLHARVEALESSVMDKLRNAGKKAADYAKKAVASVSGGGGAITLKSLNEFVHKLVGGDFTPGVDDGATTWTFSVKGKQMVLTYRPGESHATLNGATYNNIAALQSAAKTIAMNAGAGASIAEMRVYTASILRQQAMLLEEPL